MEARRSAARIDRSTRHTNCRSVPGLNLIQTLNRHNQDIPFVLLSAHDPRRGVTDQVSAALVKSKTSTQMLADTITSLAHKPIGAVEPRTQGQS